MEIATLNGTELWAGKTQAVKEGEIAEYAGHE